MLVSVDRERGVSEPISVTIVTAIAEQEGVDPTEIRPPEYESLYDVCNPEALDALFSYDETATNGTISFTFCGYDVRVSSNGTVTVTEPSS